MTDKLMIYISISGKSRQGFVLLTRRMGFDWKKTLRKMKSVFEMHLFQAVIVISTCIRGSRLYRILIQQMEHLSREDYSINIRLMDGNISIREIRC